MTNMSNAPIHKRAKLRRPTYTNASMATPRRRPKLQLLRSSCGHVMGICLVGKRQRVFQWAVCR